MSDAIEPPFNSDESGPGFVPLYGAWPTAIDPPSDSGADDFYREVGADAAPPPNYNTILREYLDLYANQPPRQAEMIIPGWALERLNALPQEQRKSILLEIDRIAADHGLLTPTKLIVTPNAR